MIVPVPATADTWINGNATSTNYSSDVNAFLGWQQSGGAAGIKRSLLEFDVPEFPTDEPTMLRLRLNILTADLAATLIQFGLLSLPSPAVLSQATWLEYITGNVWPSGAGAGGDIAFATSEIVGPVFADVGTDKDFHLSELLPNITPGSKIFLLGYNVFESGATKQFSFATLENAGTTPPTLLFTVPDESGNAATRASPPYRAHRRGT